MTSLFLTLLLLSSLQLISSSTQGLKSLSGDSLEILSLETRAYLEGPYAQIQQIQTYKNPTLNDLETEYHFPRTESSIFHKFEARIRNQTIVGTVLEKQQALNLYKKNIEQGNTVAYSDRSEAAPDVMKIMIGNIPPNETVEITFSIIQPLDVVFNKFLGLTLPAVLTERYAPSNFSMGDAPIIENVDLKDAYYKQWKVYVEITSQTPFEKLLNPTHSLEPKVSEQPTSENSRAYKAVWEVNTIPDKNFIIYYRVKDQKNASLVLAEHPNFPKDDVLLVSFIPELNSFDSEKIADVISDIEEGFLALKNLILQTDVQTARGEFVFIIDRSGSMGGNRINNLKRALTKFLESLPKDSYFNIISYGSSYEPYAHSSIRSSPETLSSALKWIETIDADMGGTEILSPLEYAISQSLMEEYPRTVILITDGDVYNTDQIISLVYKNSHRMRFSTVGVGHGASENLIRNVAKAGRGVSEFVLDNEEIAEKCMYIIEAAISQHLKNIDLNVTCLNDWSGLVYKYQDKVDFLLKDEAFKKWVYLPNAKDIKTCSVEVSYYNSMERATVFERFEVNSFENPERTNMWHKIAYDAKIKDLDLKIRFGDDGHRANIDVADRLKKDIIDTSVRYQILSDYTAFFAVLDEMPIERERRPQVKAKIANMQSADYSSARSGASQSAYPQNSYSDDQIVYLSNSGIKASYSMPSTRNSGSDSSDCSMKKAAHILNVTSMLFIGLMIVLLSSLN